MDFWTQLLNARVPSDSVLCKIDSLIDWRKVGWKVGKVRSNLGRAGYDVDLLLRVTLLSRWYSLSDRELGSALKVRLDFMRFCGSRVIEHCPDHSTICRFRNELVKRSLFEGVLDEVNDQLKRQNLMIEAADMAIVDATLIETAARPCKEIELIPEDRKEDETPDSTITERLSADPDARWIKKGRKSMLGYVLIIRRSAAFAMSL